MLSSRVAILHDNAVHGEDTYLVRDLGVHACLDAVMDGVTGRRGAEASHAVRDALANAALTSPDGVGTVLSGVNERLYRRGLGPHWLTTVSTALAWHGTLYVTGAGDSPVLLRRGDTTQYLVGATRGFGSRGIAGALGAQPQLRRLQRVEVALLPDDWVVLATDGITDNVTADELQEIIQHATEPAVAVAHLRALLSARQQADRAPTPLGEGFRHDDRTAIVRCFCHANG